MKKTGKRLLSLALSLALAVTLIPAAGTAAYADDDYRISNVSSLDKVTGLKTQERDNDEIDLIWNPVEGASGYEVYRYSVKDSKWILLGRSDDADFGVDNLLSATAYSFRVKAFAKKADGSVIYGDNSKTYKTCTRPNDVKNLRASEKSSSTITLKWNSVKRADGYQVYRYDGDSGKWVRLITTGKTSYKASGLDSGSSYKFRIRPYRDALNSRYYGDYETITVKTSASGSSSGSASGAVTESKAKSIALNHAGVSSSAAEFLRVEVDYDDGVKVYEIEFEAGDYEYDYEINANNGTIRDWDRDSRWD